MKLVIVSDLYLEGYKSCPGLDAFEDPKRAFASISHRQEKSRKRQGLPFAWLAQLANMTREPGSKVCGM